MSGWIAIHRGSFEHELFERAPVTEWEAWARLISRAAWKKTTHRIRGNVHDVERGSFYCTLRELQAEFMWGSPNRVERFLKMLSERNMAVVSRETAKTYITICNYDKYQSTENNGGTANGTAVDTATEQPRNTKGTSKQINKEQEDKSARSPSGSRLPSDWVPDEAYFDYAKSKGWSSAAVQAEAENFRDYWISVAGAKGRKADWLATWRTWIRRSTPKSPSTAPATKATRPDETLLHFEAEREKQAAARKAMRSGGPSYTIGSNKPRAASHA